MVDNGYGQNSSPDALAQPLLGESPEGVLEARPAPPSLPFPTSLVTPHQVIRLLASPQLPWELRACRATSVRAAGSTMLGIRPPHQRACRVYDVSDIAWRALDCFIMCTAHDVALPQRCSATVR